MVHHERNRAAEEDQAPAEEQEQAPAEEQPAYAPPAADPADEIEHLAQLHTSGVLTDEEFAAAKSKILGI
jgi:Short C-terminal domain